jgi:adenosine deaminase
VTVHAGEAYGPGSIRSAIDHCGAQRIGHARTLVDDPDLEGEVKRRGIGLECCPSSNVQISLTPEWRLHPVAGYLRRGLLVTLATDNRLLTGIRVTDEYERARTHLGCTDAELGQLALNGFKMAFLPEDEKASMVRRAEEEIRACLA